MKTPEAKNYASQQADVVVFHRPDHPDKLRLARLLKSMGKKVVFDNDDTFKDDGGFKFNKYLDKERLERNLASLNETLDTFVTEADLVTVSTQFLADEYSKLNPNTIVLPNCIDPFYFDEPKRNQGDKVRIGITGSIGVTSDFEIAYRLMEKTLDDPRFRWVLWSLPKGRNEKIIKELYYNEFKMINKLEGKIEWHGFVDQDLYYDKLNDLELDIMVIPRADNYFNRCKSNIKFLEASMFEIPVIAQGFPDGKSPYQVDPEDAEHMIIANNEDEFIKAIDELASDKEKRVTMGKKAKEYVINKYNIQTNGHLWQKAYQNLFPQTK
jgi:glycosyltransferase involved in cell wall biosynthesis